MGCGTLFYPLVRPLYSYPNLSFLPSVTHSIHLDSLTSDRSGLRSERQKQAEGQEEEELPWDHGSNLGGRRRGGRQCRDASPSSCHFALPISSGMKGFQGRASERPTRNSPFLCFPQSSLLSLFNFPPRLVVPSSIQISKSVLPVSSRTKDRHWNEAQEMPWEELIYQGVPLTRSSFIRRISII